MAAQERSHSDENTNRRGMMSKLTRTAGHCLATWLSRSPVASLGDNAPQRRGELRAAPRAFAILLAVVVGLACVSQPGVSLGEAADNVILQKATTSREALEAARASIPLDELTEQMQARITAVVSNPSMYRRMPVQRVRCDPDLHLFLVRYPEIVVNIWELMGITKVSVRRTGEFTYHATDTSGTTSDVELVYGTAGKHLFYADAVYNGPLSPRPLAVKCVLLLNSRYVRTSDGRHYVTDQLDVFIRVENVAADVVIRALHPLVGKTSDHNFTQSIGFLSRISKTAEANGPGIQRLAARLTKVQPQVRQRFAQLTAAVSKKAAEADPVPQPVTTSPKTPDAAHVKTSLNVPDTSPAAAPIAAEKAANRQAAHSSESTVSGAGGWTVRRPTLRR